MRSIPDGYTYTRCDRYSADEFVEQFESVLGKSVAAEYIQDNPKEEYSTDDQIAVMHIIDARRVPGLIHGQNRHTTKRTYYTDR